MSFFRHIVAALFYVVFLMKSVSFAQTALSPTYYEKTCPNVTNIIKSLITSTVPKNPKITAQLVRVQFHDCFVQGCDASLLLDDPTDSEKKALPNLSIEGFDLLDEMKKALETVCPKTVSCADIVTIASTESVAISGGPKYEVPLGRLDSRTAAGKLAGAALPGSGEPLADLKAKFKAVGLDTAVDLVALSGAHTFGTAQCLTFDQRLYNFSGAGDKDPDLSDALATKLRAKCPSRFFKGQADLDHTTPNAFDNAYFKNLVAKEGLLQSDQILFSEPGADTVELVKKYSTDQAAFFADFGKSMIRMGNIKPPASVAGEVRLNCRVANADIQKTTPAGPAKNDLLVKAI